MRWTSTVADASGMFEKTRSIVLLYVLRFGMVVASSGSFSRSRSCLSVHAWMRFPSCEAGLSACQEVWKAFILPATIQFSSGGHSLRTYNVLSSSGLL